MSAEPRGRTLQAAASVGAAVVGLALAAGAALFLLHGRRWFVHQGYPEGAALGLGLSELAAGLLFAVPRTRLPGAAGLLAVLGWAAGFHFALRQSTVGLFGWMAAVAAILVVGRLALRRAAP